MKRLLLLIAGLVLGSCHSDWDEVFLECVSSGRCVTDGGAGGGGGGGGPPDGGTGGGGGGPVVTLSGTTFSFSGVVVFELSAAQQLIITNEGPGPVASLNLQLQEFNFSDFSLTSQCAGVLLQGDACAVSLRFSPSAEGPRSTLLRVTPAGQPTQEVALAGTGLPALEFEPAPFVFPDTSVGSQSRQNVTVTNRTAGAQTPTYVFSNPALFQKDSSCAVLAANAPCTFGLTFSPPDAGAFTGTLAASVGAGQQTFNAALALSGNGLQLGSLRLSPVTLFDGQVVDAGSAFTTAFTLANVATTAIGPITVSLQPAGSAFTITDAGCVTLDAGASCSGLVRFAPQSIGEFDATLIANAGLGGSATAPLHAVGAGSFTTQVTVTPGGERVTTDAGFSCTGSCPLSVYVVPPAFPTVTLEAQRTFARTGFDRWTGDCAGSSPSCPLVMDQNRTVTAVFEPVNLAFVTSFSVNGNLGGLDGGDALCQLAAADAGLGGTYRAWLSSTAENAADRLNDAGGWIRVDGLPFAASLADLMAGKVLYPLRVDEHGLAVDAGLAWTNTTADGGLFLNPPDGNCRNWTSANTAEFGSLGSVVGGTTLWTNPVIDRNCGTANRLYCLQTDHRIATQPLRVPPGGLVLFLSAGSAPVASGRAGLDAFCDQQAASAGLAGSFNAFVGGTGVSAPSRINPTASGPLYRPDGVRLLADLAPLRTTEVDFLAAPNVMPDGGYVADSLALVATGAYEVLLNGDLHCVNWMGNFVTDTTRVGEYRSSTLRRNDIAGYFDQTFVMSCENPLRVYCVPR